MLVENYPYPFIFLGSSTPIALITLITTFKLLILRYVFSDQGIMRGKTLQYTPIAFILLKVLILRGILVDQGNIRGKTPHSTLITLLLKIRGKTPRLYGGH